MEISQPSTKDYYETLVKGYDELGDKVVMENPQLQEAIFNSIPFSKDRKINVLDLGIGTASTAHKILTQYSNSFIIGVDFSDEMIRVANHTLEDFPGRFRLVQADINGLDLKRYGGFDLVISAVTIHNIPHEAKVNLFIKIFNCLNEGGIFINGDFVAGETEAEEANTKSIYKNFLEKNLFGDELQKWLEHAFGFDMPMKLSEHKKFLKKSGFTSVQVVWEHPREAVYVATK